METTGRGSMDERISPIPHGNAKEGVLRELCRQGLERRLAIREGEYEWPQNRPIIDRMERELAAFVRLSACDYLYVIHEIVTMAEGSGILLDPGQGTAGCSLALYLLGITEINPLVHDLPFERYIRSGDTCLPGIFLGIPDEFLPRLQARLHADGMTIAPGDYYDDHCARCNAILSAAASRIRAERCPTFDLRTIALDDSATLALISRGDTDTLFALGAPESKKLCRENGVDGFERLAFLMALDHICRGQACGVRYILQRCTPEDSLVIRDLCVRTGGACVYQEQWMRILERLAGFSMADVNEARRSFGKKKADEIEVWRTRFTNAVCAAGTADQATAEKTFDWLYQVANLLYCKASIINEALLCYRTAYLKVHFIDEYYGAMLTVDRQRLQRGR